MRFLPVYLSSGNNQNLSRRSLPVIKNEEVGPSYHLAPQTPQISKEDQEWLDWDQDREREREIQEGRLEGGSFRADETEPRRDHTSSTTPEPTNSQ